MDRLSISMVHAGVLVSALASARPAAAQEIIVEEFHDCCDRTIRVYDDARHTNEPSCNRAEQVLDSSCDGVCCFFYAFVDPCPGIIGCPTDPCELEFDRPDSECADTDGDGLLDSWETGAVSGVDVPSVADPLRKDLFVELDHAEGTEPNQMTVREAKRAFCAAPDDAGGVFAPGGIRLWVDAGDLVDPFEGIESPIGPCSCGDGIDNDGEDGADAADPKCLELMPYASEDGAGPGSCDDGIDNGTDGADGADGECLALDRSRSETDAAIGTCLNGLDDDGDGLLDTNDPDCLVGDNFGGGNFVGVADVKEVKSALFDAVKTVNFAAAREKVFRYALVAPDGPPDVLGEAPIGGRDLLLFDGIVILPTTFVHELGHSLNLHHGGNEGHNCKPGYVSVMNYNLGFGIPQSSPLMGQDIDADGVRDGVIADFSPPRFVTPSGLMRGIAPLPSLVESDLDEALILDPSDPVNQFAYTNLNGGTVRETLNGDIDNDGNPDGIDWTGDNDTDDGPGLHVNIDTADFDECQNSVIGTTAQSGYDDWHNISLRIGSGTEVANAQVVTEPTVEQMLAVRVAINTTDLMTQVSATPVPVEVGDPLIYTVAVHNQGPNPADEILVEETLPALAPYAGHSAAALSCTAGSATLSCAGGQLRPRRETGFEFAVDTQDACVGGIPAALSTTVQASNVAAFAGDDPDPADNTVTLVTTPVDTTPPTIEQLAVDTPTLWPPNHALVPVTVSATVTDICDDHPSCAVVAVTSNEPERGAGTGNQAPDFVIESATRVSVRAERSGQGNGRIYTLTFACSDAVGNVASAPVTVSVPHNR